MKRARLRPALESFKIDFDEAEALIVARRPFEVVQQGPVNIAAHVDTFVQALAYFRESGIDIGHATRIVVSRNAAFGDVDGSPGPACGQADRRPQRLRIELVTGRRHLRIGGELSLSACIHAYAGV